MVLGGGRGGGHTGLLGSVLLVWSRDQSEGALQGAERRRRRSIQNDAFIYICSPPDTSVATPLQVSTLQMVTEDPSSIHVTMQQ